MIPHNTACACASSTDADRFDPNYVSAVLDRHGRNGSALLSILAEIQERFRYLPAEALRIVSRETGRPLVDIYAAATFYKSFSLSPKGRHIVTACLGTACHVRGGQRAADELGRQLGIGDGETTQDGEFTLETANCLGACAVGPVVVIDGRCFSKATPSKVGSLIEDTLRARDTEPGEDNGRFAIEAVCPRCGADLMDPGLKVDGRPSIRLNVEFGLSRGWVGLSSLYGSGAFESEHDIPVDTMVTFVCPHCDEKLADSWHCPTCAAPMAPIGLRWGGTLRLCARRGCGNRLLDLA